MDGRRLYLTCDNILLHTQPYLVKTILDRCKIIHDSEVKTSVSELKLYAIATVKALKRNYKISTHSTVEDIMKKTVEMGDESPITYDEFSEIMSKLGYVDVETDDTLGTNLSKNLDNLVESTGINRLVGVYNNDLEYNYIKNFIPTITNIIHYDELIKRIQAKETLEALLLTDDKDLIVDIISLYDDTFYMKVMSTLRNKPYFDDMFGGMVAFSPITYIDLKEDFEN